MEVQVQVHSLPRFTNFVIYSLTYCYRYRKSKMNVTLAIFRKKKNRPEGIK
jgi:hypothetical protein